MNRGAGRDLSALTCAIRLDGQVCLNRHADIRQAMVSEQHEQYSIAQIERGSGGMLETDIMECKRDPRMCSERIP